MSNWGITGPGKEFVTLPAPVTASSYPSATYTTPGSANTKGTAVELDSALDVDAWGLWITLHTSTQTSFLVDLLVGAATEDVLIANMLAWVPRANEASMLYFFPLHIPKGARLALAAQAAAVSSVLYYQVRYGTAPIPGQWYGTRVTTYGAVTGTSLGTAITQNASAHTKSRTSLGSITNPIRALVLGAKNVDTAAAATRYEFEVQYGSSNIAATYGMAYQGTGPDLLFPSTWYWPGLDIPAAGNLSIDCQSSVAGAETPHMIAYGID